MHETQLRWKQPFRRYGEMLAALVEDVQVQNQREKPPKSGQ
jgi:hypothetical protein